MSEFGSEKELAAAVVQWLIDQHWEVYQEVQMGAYEKIADIVAVLDRKVWVIETKMSLSMTLLDQADSWRPWAHFVSVAVPGTRKRRPQIVDRILRWTGIGLLVVNRGVSSAAPAKIQRASHRGAKDLLARLQPEHKTWAAAGTSDGDRWTPFASTAREVQRFVSGHPGCTLKQLMDGITHHYCGEQSARCAIPKSIRSGWIEGVRLQKEGRVLRLYPKKEGIR